MNKILGVLFLCFFSQSFVNAQKRLLTTLDTTTVYQNNIIESYDVRSFFSSGLAEQTLDLESLDIELLEATLFFVINKRRKKPLVFSPILQSTTQQITNSYSKGMFKKNLERRNRLQKYALVVSRKLKYGGSFIAASTDYLPLLQYNQKRKYKFDEEADEQKYYYRPRKKRAPPQEKDYIAKHTYLSFAQQINRRNNYQSKRIFRSKAYQHLGCAIVVVQSSERRMPYAKIFWVAGAYRLMLLPKE